MKDCKTCEHATIMFRREKEDRFSSAYVPSGFVRCSAPRYKGRAFFVRDNRSECDDHASRSRERA